MSIDIVTINNGKCRAINLQTTGRPITLKYNPKAQPNNADPAPCNAEFTVYRWDGVNSDSKMVDSTITWGPTPTDQNKKRAMIPGNGIFLIVPSFDIGSGMIQGVRTSDRAPESCTFTTLNESSGTEYSATISMEDGNVPE